METFREETIFTLDECIFIFDKSNVNGTNLFIFFFLWFLNIRIKISYIIFG